MCGGLKKGENPSALGKNKIQWITDLPAGLRGRVIFGKVNEVTIGDRIRRIRKKRRLTQAELAMMSGLSLSAIQGYEQGRYEPKRKSLESIAEVFKIPVDELYDMPAQLSTNLAEVGKDCISRQAAIDALYSVDEYNSRSLKAIKQLPPIQPEPHWIPIDLENNEPPLEEWVLVSSDGYVMQDCIVERGGKKIWYHGGNIQVNDRYMPLPEPYKGVTDGRD